MEDRGKDQADFDAVIVGGGPAGLSAALVLGRMRRTVLVCDTGDPANAVSHGIGGLLSRDGIPPQELRAISHEQIEQYPSVEFRDAEVRQARRRDEGFLLTVGDEEVRTRKVLLAHGLNYELPLIPGLPELWGETIFHCPYCHGWEVRDRRIGVIVTSERAVNQALLLRPLSDDIVVFANEADELDGEALRRFDSCGVPLVDGAVEAVKRDGDGVRVVVDGREPLLRDALFVQTELSLRTDLASQLGAGLDDTGAIEVDPAGATKVPGLRAAGDAALPPQAVAAAIGCGTIAAYSINAELALEPFEQGSPVADADPG
ncbi:MAG: NAD(P)/FAD-dependent oxidoreductase [Actinomycetota bacterium]|nr:NAD(P)/FAD-dependent oxidoreductase [Actinomycetota bacterium]